MMGAALCVAAVLVGSQPAVDESPPADPGSRPQTHPGIRMVDARIDDARRVRFFRNGVQVALGASQLALGGYALSIDGSKAVRRTGIKQVASGGVAVAVGGVFLFLPSSLERLTEDPEYEALRRAPSDPDAVRGFERRFESRARQARILRYLSAAGYLTAGVVVTTWGGVSLALEQPNGRDDGRVWGLATINSGLLLMAGGVLDFLIRSPIERTLQDYRGERPAPRVVVSVRPGLRGCAFSLQF